MKESNINTKPQKCTKCNYKSKNETQMKQHNERVHIKKRQTEALHCEFCEYTTETSYEMNMHEHKSHRNNAIKCNLCDFRAKDEDILKKHHAVAMGHKKKIICRFFMNGSCKNGRFCKFEHRWSNSQINSKFDGRQQSGNINGLFANQQQHQSNMNNDYYHYQPQQFGHNNDQFRGRNNRQCKYKESCFKFPNCGFAHGEICRYQEQCLKGDQCRFVHLPQNFLGTNSPSLLRN